MVGTLARAFQALATDQPDQAIGLLTDVMAEHERIGGSRAQRDLLEIALASALLSAGHADEARRSLNMRRPHTAHDHAIAGLAH